MNVNAELNNKILEMFVGNDPIRKVLHDPFIVDDYAYATDSHIICRIKKSLLNNIIFRESGYTPDPTSLFSTTNCNQIISVDNVGKALRESEKIHSDMFEKEQVHCPDCFGNGNVQYEFRDYKYNLHTIDETCPTCIGLGEINSTKHIPSGESIYDEVFQLISFNASFYKAIHFSKVFLVASMNRIDEISIINISEGGNLTFSVGDFTIIFTRKNIEESDKYTVIPLT